MEREKGISKPDWDAMVARAANQMLIEEHPVQSDIPAPTFESLGSIEQSEFGGGVERVLGKALGWTTYDSGPDND